MAAKRQYSPRKPTLLSIAKQAQKAGIAVARYEVEPSGKIILITSADESVSVERNNPWNEVLNGGGEHASKQKRSA